MQQHRIRRTIDALFLAYISFFFFYIFKKMKILWGLCP